tara:strand:- start:704 stop:1033 length:330 start_codon:yes stop_codon:yes gene_type:complete
MKFSLIVNKEVLGYIDYTDRKDYIFINLILIYKKYRGNNYSQKLFSEFRGNFIDREIHLFAKEDMDRYNKLFSLYESWGFEAKGKISIRCDTSSTIRQRYFILKPDYFN